MRPQPDPLVGRNGDGGDPIIAQAVRVRKRRPARVIEPRRAVCRANPRRSVRRNRDRRDEIPRQAFVRGVGRVLNLG